MERTFCAFLNEASGSPFTASRALCGMLTRAGFEELKESDLHWSVRPGGRYYFSRNQSSVMAFLVGGSYAPGNGFSCAMAHTDSPALKLKPCSTLHDTKNYSLVSCETYGGGIWQTWFDRELGFTGKVVVAEPDGSLCTRVVSVKRPLMRISTVATHLDMNYLTEGHKVNKETDLRAVLAQQGDAGLQANAVQANPVMCLAEGKPKHSPVLLRLAAEDAKCQASQIVAADLRLCDTQPACVSGANEEFVVGQGIDNLNGAFTTTQAFIESCTGDCSGERNIRMLGVFDHEECGSLSSQGAESPLVVGTMERILLGLANSGAVAGLTQTTVRESMFAGLRKSLVLSVDNAHAIHPNNQQKHESQIPPEMNRGPVIKFNCNCRYASDAEGAALLQVIARKHGVPLQEFVIRQDANCGTTIGPTTAAKTGMRVVDLGNPQLSMHSIREVCGSKDVQHMVDLVRSFFVDFSQLRTSFA